MEGVPLMEKPEEPQTLDQITDATFAATNEEVEAETPEVSNEAKTETEEKEESYTRIDPKTLPPELQAMHKSLLSDYTKKTQSLAQQRKEFEQLMQQAQTQQPTQEQTSRQKPVENQVDISSMSVDEYTAYMMSQIDERLNAYETEQLQKQEQKYLDKAVAEFEATDERLNPLSPAYDEDMRTSVGTKLDKALSKYQEENGTAIGFDYQSATQDLVNDYEQKLEAKAGQIATKKTQEAFKGVKRTAPMGVKGSKAPSKPNGKMSLDEALENAFS